MSDPCFFASLFSFYFLSCSFVRCHLFPRCPDIASPFPAITSYNSSLDVHPKQTKHHPNPSSPSPPSPEYQKRSTYVLCTLDSPSFKKNRLPLSLFSDSFIPKNAVHNWRGHCRGVQQIPHQCRSYDGVCGMVAFTVYQISRQEGSHLQKAF